MELNAGVDPWWITGITDGEGTFTFSRTGSGNLSLYYALKLTKADEETVYKVADYFGVGRIYEAKARAPAGRAGGATKTATLFRVTRHDELPVVVDHFLRYPLQSKKRDAFRIWHAMVEIKSQFRGRNRGALQELALALSAAQPRNQSWR